MNKRTLFALQHTVSWEPEGRYWYSKMFCWEPEGRYRCTMFMAITPFRFSMEHLWIVIAPFWFSMEHLWIVIAPFWLSNWRHSNAHLWKTISIQGGNILYRLLGKCIREPRTGFIYDVYIVGRYCHELYYIQLHKTSASMPPGQWAISTRQYTHSRSNYSAAFTPYLKPRH